MAERFATTLPYFSDSEFAARARYLCSAHWPQKAGSPVQNLIAFAAVLWAASRSRVLVLDSAWKSDLLAACCIGLWPRSWRPGIVLYGEMWAPSDGLRHVLERAVVRLADRSIARYIVLSSEELVEFPRTWKLDPSKVRVNPFFFTMKEEDLSGPMQEGGYVFAGGNSHRDYGPLVEAARRLPAMRFVIASNRLSGRRDLPANVEAGPVSYRDFMSLLRGAKAVVVPLRRGLRRSAGQQTILNAMRVGKPVVVTEAFGVRDHIEHGRNGLIVDGSPESLVETLLWLGDSANRDAVLAMRERAQATAAEDNFKQHVARVLRVVDEL